MIRDAFRAIARMPGLAAVVVVSLGVGIGVNTAVFSWIQTVLLRPLAGVPGGGSTFYLIEAKADTGTFPGSSWLEYRDLQERVHAFDGLLAFRPVPLNVGESSRTERTYAMLVSGNYFAALGLRPAAGRFLQPSEVDQPGGDPLAVISYDYWQTHFDRDPGVVGRSIRANGQPLTIVGVAPELFQGTTLGLQFDMWVPATMAPSLLIGSRELEDRNQRGYMIMGQLRENASEAQANAEVVSTMRDLARAYPETNAALVGQVVPFAGAPRGPQRMIVTGLTILQIAMLLVLAVVCGNTANLVLARASTRFREIGVRLTLGAGPARVIRLVLAENLVLSLLGSALGIVIAMWGTSALRAMPAYGAFPVRFHSSVDAMGLGFAVLLGILCGLLFGLAPALQLGHVDPQQALRTGARASGRSVMRDTLMGLQVALAVLVLVAAALFYQSFAQTREADPGFRTDGLMLAAYDLTGRITTDDYPRDFARRLLERLRAVPGVESVAISTSVPLDIHGLPLRSFTLEGRAQSSQAPDTALSNTVTPDYFKAMDTPLVGGEGFVDLGDTSTAPQVVVNEEFARRYISGEVLGRRLTYRGGTYQIAGIVRTSTYDAFGEPPTPAFFYSYRDRPSGAGEIHLRVRPGTEAVMGSEVQRAVREIDPTLPVYNIRTMREHIDKNLMLRKIPARMFVVIGPLLLALVGIGIYAVVAYAVAHRTSEIGVRLALGATANGVVRQIAFESLKVIGFGAACGWLIALMIDLHLFSGGVDDMPAMIGVPLVILSVATFACWVPARRATTVDPLVALRHE
ncbi:MAG: ABC transporter permease [Vicinamibacterales bacterium]